MAPNRTTARLPAIRSIISENNVKADTVDSPEPSPPETPTSESSQESSQESDPPSDLPTVTSMSSTSDSHTSNSVTSHPLQPINSVLASRIHSLLPAGNVRHESMRREINRLNTYERWPVTFMDPRLMAAAGFYYTGKADVVKCAFCSMEFNQWQEGDNPLKDHRRFSPNCPFILRIPIGNEPLSQSGERSRIEEELANSYDTCGVYGNEFRPFSGPETRVNGNLEKLGICPTSGPIFPQYASYESRMQTYDCWPVSLKQRPDKLSDAGFYYTGKGDQTVCFYCGGGLKDWEDNDDPWNEHARWFSKCVFVQMVKGPDFIRDAASTKSTIMSAEQIMELKSLIDLKASQENCSQPPVPCKSVAGTSKDHSETQKGKDLEESMKKIDVGESEKTSDDMTKCQICYVAEREMVFLPCGHFFACAKCAAALTNCAVCRQTINGVVKAYMV